jgi:hypothetical protein
MASRFFLLSREIIIAEIGLFEQKQLGRPFFKME